MYADPYGQFPIVVFAIILLSISLTAVLVSIDLPNAERTGPTFAEPSFGKFTKDSFTLISIGGFLGRQDWYLNKKKDISIYFSGYNLGLSIGGSYDSNSFKDIFSIDASIFEIGYDGKYIDLSYAMGLNNDHISVDFYAIYQDIMKIFN